MKKISNFINDFVIAGVGAFATLRYFLFERGTIDAITKVCLLLIAIAGVGKVYLGWKFPVIDNFKFIPRTKPEKYLNIVEDDDFNKLKILKGGKKKMKNIWKTLIALIRANKFTLSGNLSIIAAYFILVDELFVNFGYTVLNQPNEFYIRGGIYTLGLILALIAANGVGWETIEKWFARINQKKLDKIVNALVNITIEEKPDLVENSLKEAYFLLEKIEPFIKEKLYQEIKNKLDEINNKLKKYNANKLLQQEKERQELLKLAQQELNQHHTPTPPSNNRGLMR